MSRRVYADDPSELSTPVVLRREVPWETYLTARLISDRDLQLIKRYDKANRESQAQLLKEVCFISPSVRCSIPDLGVRVVTLYGSLVQVSTFLLRVFSTYETYWQCV